MRSVKRRDTLPEMEVRRRVHAMGMRYFVDHRVLEKPIRKADLAFPKLKIAVFIDGCFWHGCPIHGTKPKENARFWYDKLEMNKRRDTDTDERLEKAGWSVIRVWAHERPEKIADLVRSEVTRRRRELWKP